MNRPYIICHMMMSLDGRIDCGMTIKIKGSQQYYETLSSLQVDSTLSGRVTAELEMAKKGKFVSENPLNTISKECFKKERDSKGYQIIVDSKGALLWEYDSLSSEPLLVLTTTKATKEYLSYLEGLHISYIVSGKERVDLNKAMEVLFEKFNVKRLAIVGGGNINGSFLEQGLLDEVSILLGPGIDGRKGMVATFDGREKNANPINLTLLSLKSYANGAVYLRYKVNRP